MLPRAGDGGGVDTWRDCIGVETRLAWEGIGAEEVEGVASTGFF